MQTKTCPDCNGSGLDPQAHEIRREEGMLQGAAGLADFPEERCRTCKGRGEIPEPCACGGTYRMARFCGAYVCDDCEDHAGLCRCYCGWSSSGGNGRAELVEMGETIDEPGGEDAHLEAAYEDRTYAPDDYALGDGLY